MLRRTSRRLRVLDFDCEARPDAYLGGDLTTRSLTAIAAAFCDSPEDMWCEYLVADPERGTHREQMISMLENFRALYDAADVVTGHNILSYDLPVINGHMVYCGLPMLGETLASDTLHHGPKSALSYSRSMENMGDMFGLTDGKHHMSNSEWKRVNTLDEHLLGGTVERVTSDVAMHIQLRAAMIEAGVLDPPKRWRP